MDKKRLLSSMTVVGYGMMVVFIILAIVIGIMLSINGFGKPEKKVNNIIISMPEDSQGVTTENNITSITTQDTQKTIEFKIAGAAGVDTVDYSTREITVVINNSSTDFAPAKKEDTSVWFAQKNAAGEILTDDDGNYIPVENNRINVKVNDTITLILATTQYPDDELNPDPDALYIKGGISHIHARSGDLLLEAQELKVQVDVPVENFEVIVYGYDYNDTTNRKVDLTDSVKKTEGISYKNIKDVENESDEFLNISDTTQDYLGRTMHFVGESTAKYTQGKYYTVVKGEGNTIKWEENNSLRYFIQGTELELGVRAFPENSTSAILGNFKTAVFSLERVSQDSAIIEAGSNLLNIVGFDDDTTGSIKVVATLPILLNGTQRVETDIIIETAAYEIEKLEITNSQIKDSTISCLLNKQLSVAFNQNVVGSEDVNLGINIVPKFFNGHNNPYENDFTSIYAELRTNHGLAPDPTAGIICVNSLGEGFVEPISGITTNEQKNGNKTINKTASFTANRMLLSDERVYLIISDQQNFTDTQRPYAVFNIAPTINKPETNQQNEELNELVYNKEIPISFAKEDERYIELAGKSYPVSALVNNEKITSEGILDELNDNELGIVYTKETEKPIIYPTSSQVLFTKWVFFVQKAPDDVYTSNVLLLSNKGQIKSLTTYGSQAYAVGQGNVDIYPKLVLCDQTGNPFNCFYQTFTADDNTGYLMLEDVKSTDLTAENENNYVVIFDPHISEKIMVTENLTELTFFYDISLTDKVEGDVEIAANDIKDFYLIANSKSALKNSKQGRSLQAILKMSGDRQYNLGITYDEINYNYASFSVEDRPADDDCSIEFRLNDNLIDSINPQIKVVDIQSVDAIFDVVQELKTNLLEKDNHRRVLYDGVNMTIQNTDGESFNAINGKFYIVKQKMVDEKTVYYWDNDEEYARLEYANNIKKITIKEQVDGSSNVKFDMEALTLPKSVYYNLTIKQAHGYENKDVVGTKAVDFKVFAISNPTKIIKKEDIPTLTQSNLANYIKLKVCDGSIKLALYDGWKNEINGLDGKYLYLVYTMSVNSILKAVDSYRIDFDLSSADILVTKKSGAVNLLYMQKEPEPNHSSTSLIYLDSISGPQVTDVRPLLSITNNKTSTTVDYNLSGTTLNAVLMGNAADNINRDYSIYVTIAISETGLVTMSTVSDAYRFTVENIENPIAQTGQYKITVQSFVEVEGSNAFFAIDIPLTLGFNVAYTT